MRLPDASPERRHVGGDFYLTPAVEVDGELRVDVGFPHPEWRARREGDVQRAAFPGSAVRVDGERWYEIVRAEVSDGLPRRHSYFLRPWDDSSVIRKAYELTPEACQKVTREHWREKRRQATGETLGLFPFLLGMLPADVQVAIERRYGLPAGRNTLISAVLLLALSSLVGMLSVVRMVGHDLGPFEAPMDFLGPFKLLFVYLGVESLLRLPKGMHGEALGSLPVAVPIVAARSLARSLGRDARRRSAAERQFNASVHAMAGARDEVRRLADRDGLEIVSRLPKDHWTAHSTGIYYRGEAYLLTDRRVVRTRDGVRHHFVLEKPRHEVLFTSATHYRPEEVRDVWRASRRLDAAMWVETFRALWGFLDQETQLRLGRTYDYDPWKFTRRAIALAAVVGALGFAGAAADMVLGRATGADGFWFFAGIVLVWEALLRRRHYRRAEIRGSLVGLALRPLASLALRWEQTPHHPAQVGRPGRRAAPSGLRSPRPGPGG